MAEVIADGADALGERGGPGEAGDASGRLGLLLDFHAEAGLGFRGSLKFGAKPADQAGAFFCGAGGVEFDQAEEDVFGGKGGGPTIGFGDGEVEIVVKGAENRYEALVMDDLGGGPARSSISSASPPPPKA